MKKYVAVCAVAFVFSVTDNSYAAQVNGILKDECKYLLTAIEKTVEQVEAYSEGNESTAGAIADQFGLGTLSTVYKNLCD